ncbi:SDR family NAD(P)-dependent oxidoreductase [Phytomonospora endophytica]|uniref:NAD(P)-dependent dehydrogenase (Short-subunit alcohol dehydrogenase family) n=1 Tax=Phytomonospora endophytica TaxID=714109 RepID=A0A841FM41_9ACTN|nr:SDR family NAD(P)-dependent oxidoreductase [Phytomonospora endophytica]MBB6034868.1 NAD(P)-dependent dehydrogenase (short-subunit alcohol dehydrogenase family) [Phytomonospora endophytica]GIG70572.1 short-chain dehydrogenase [Phytomonospora endophytica]
MTAKPLAFVTGAASGIGFATAVRLARAGYDITAADVDAVGLQRTAHAVGEAGGTATTHAFDIRDDTALTGVLDATGTPAVLANIAGVGVAAPLADTSTEDWDRVISINLTAVFTTCRAVIPRMLAAGGGNIVNVGSVAGLVGVGNRAAYCASKGGVIALTRSIAADYAAKGIRANAICPGTVASEWIGKILADAPDPEATRRAMEARQLDGRMGSPEEVAAGIAFLVSDDGRFVNGTAFVMDGGMTAV